MADKSWIEAIEDVLSNSEKSLHYNDIANEIAEKQLRTKLGATPAQTVNSTISKDIKENKEKSIFIRTATGEYYLKSKMADLSSKNQTEIPEETSIIKAFGMYWHRSNVNWAAIPKLFGIQSTGSDIVDFSDQVGIYLLYDEAKIIYVGKAYDQSIGKRLYQHTLDRLSSRWNRFSWFGVRGIDDDGNMMTLPKKLGIDPVSMVATLEALLIEVVEPSLNRRRGDDFASIEYMQKEDPEIEDKKRKQIIAELIGNR